MSPIEGYEPNIDLEAKDWPKYKKRIGIYPIRKPPRQGDENDRDDNEKDGTNEDENKDSGEDEGDFDEDFEDDEVGEDELEDEFEDGDFEPGDEDENEGEDGDFEDIELEDIGGDFENYQPPVKTPEYELGAKPEVKKQLPALDKREFPSWKAFVDSALDESLIGWKGRRASRKIDKWSGTETWEQTLDLVKYGWPAGKKMLEDSLAVVRPRPEPYRSIEMSVAGSFPMVPNYCAGDPECMVIDPGADMRQAKPIVRIDFNHWTHAGVTTQDMMLRGAAVVSLAETLERHGYSTELRIIGNSRESGTKDFRYSIVYKRAGEPLDLIKAAFAIAHPACMRRLAFAILEQHPEAEPFYQYGYGYPLHERNDKNTDTIFVSASTGRETVEKAREAVRKAAARLLGDIKVSEEQGSND